MSDCLTRTAMRVHYRPLKRSPKTVIKLLRWMLTSARLIRPETARCDKATVALS